MGGQEAIRGFVVQSLIAIIEALVEDSEWQTLVVEPKEVSEKVDIVFYYTDHIRRIQVKSSKNLIGVTQVKKWVEELIASNNHAAVTELVLVGPCSQAVINLREFRGVNLPTPQNLNVRGLIDQAAHRLGYFLDKYTRSGVKSVVRELLVQNLAFFLEEISITGRPLTRYELVRRLLAWTRHITGSTEDDQYFRPTIRQQLREAGRIIEKLTEDQRRSIASLRLQGRALILGCAGSGKTLVAAEKSLRLSSAGLRVLLLCHSRNLAHWLRILVREEVEVWDFCAWIKLWSDCEIPSTWSPYHQPTSEELDRAFNTLVSRDSSICYDAIIVDEAQDFLEVWWLIVEAAVANSSHGLIYMFADDNQILFRSNSLLENLVTFRMSRNCRNAGSIFEIVRRFHPCAPETSNFLEGHGLYRQTILEDIALESVLSAVYYQARRDLENVDIVLITTDSDIASKSEISGLMLYNAFPESWQTVVGKYLSWVLMQAKAMAILQDLSEDLPCFSRSSFPTRSDIRKIFVYSCNLLDKLDLPRRKHWLHWICTEHETRLVTENEDDILKLEPIAYACEAILNLFIDPCWPSYLDATRLSVCPASDNEEQLPGEDSIRLYSAAEFKGLEADGVIVLSRLPVVNFNALLYIAFSRARLLLHAILGPEVIAQSGRLGWWQSD